MDAAFETNDKGKFSNIRFDSHWLFEISRKSFADTVANQEIDWLSV